MADVVKFPPNGSAVEDDAPAVEHDTFLRDEALELLAAYRAIQDPSVRSSLMQFVKALAAAHGSLGAASR